MNDITSLEQLYHKKSHRQMNCLVPYNEGTRKYSQTWCGVRSARAVLQSSSHNDAKWLCF